MSDRYPHATHVVETLVATVQDPSFLFSFPPVSIGEWEQVLGVRPAPNARNTIFRRERTDKDVIEFAGDGIMYLMCSVALYHMIPEGCVYDVMFDISQLELYLH